MAEGLNKKIGPLKAWHWLVIVGAIVAYYYYKNHISSSASTGQSNNNAIDPATGVPYALEATDPTTGLPYASELSGAGLSTGGSGGSGGGGGLTSPLDSLSSELADLQGINSELQQFGFSGIQPTTGSDATTATDPSLISSSIGTAAPAATAATVSTITTHPGGKFYKYYQQVTGHAPPSTLPTTNLVYQMWQGGVKAVTTKAGSALSGGAKTVSGGNKTPGHNTTTHTSGKKTNSTNGLKGGVGGKTTQSPEHQKASSHTPVYSLLGAAGGAVAPNTYHPPATPPKPPKENKPKKTKRKGP